MHYNRYNFLPGGVASLLQSKPGRYVYQAKGCRCWDNEGKEYLDFASGYGAILLGHANEEVNGAVRMQMERGALFPSYHPLYEALENTLLRYFPWHDSCLFHKTGSEAVAAAIRLARVVTGRVKIIRCGFHGWHDEFMASHYGWHSFLPTILNPYHPPGIPPSAHLNLLTWDGAAIHDLTEIFHQNQSQIAALILDPVQLQEPLQENLQSILRMVHNEGALLILDELKTGFRVSMSGVQGLYQVLPDLTILGKGLSNGFPLAVVLSSREIVELAPKAKIMGTFNNELLSIAAALKTISILERLPDTNHFWEIGNALILNTNRAIDKLGLLHLIKAMPYRWPCLPFLFFTGAPDKVQNFKSMFYEQLVENGLFLLPNHMNFISLSHQYEDIDIAVQKIEQSLDFCLKNESRDHRIQ